MKQIRRVVIELLDKCSHSITKNAKHSLLTLWLGVNNNMGNPSKVKNIDTKRSNKRNNQNSKDKRQDYNMK